MNALKSKPTAEGFAGRLRTFRQRADRELLSFVADKKPAAQGSLRELASSVEALLGGGGKRLRPALVYETHQALHGAAEAAALPIALATEMLHAYLLIHDDIMDHAETRRGKPACHAWFRERHRELDWPGDAADYGRSVAILVGDLAHCWAVELYQQGRREAADDVDGAALDRTFGAMCEEVIGGQFLEMRLPFKAYRQRPGETELVTALRLKSGRYSVERPMELGATLAGADEAVQSALSRYGQAAGEAFQLRDDVLGTFGDEAEVGKSVASDLMEGKHTLLIHYALELTSAEESARLQSLLGRPDLSTEEIAEARRILRDSGGLARVQERIDRCLADARTALDGVEEMTEEGRAFFLGLLEYLRERTT